MRILINGKEAGSIDISDIRYDPGTKDVYITGKILEDEELIKQVLEGDKPAFSIRAMSSISSPKDTVNFMDMPKINIMTSYGQPILKELEFIAETRDGDFPKCPEFINRLKKYADTETIDQLLDEYKELLKEGISVLADEFKRLDTTIKNGDIDYAREILYNTMLKYMVKYGISSDEASTMIMNDYKNHHKDEKNKGD